MECNNSVHVQQQADRAAATTFAKELNNVTQRAQAQHQTVQQDNSAQQVAHASQEQQQRLATAFAVLAKQTVSTARDHQTPVRSTQTSSNQRTLR
jgi:hypothetical protein